MAWPTLRMVVWMPPDCEASRSLTARATMLLAWAETMPAPAPATARPSHMRPLTSEPCSEKAMGMKAQAITMLPTWMTRRGLALGINFGMPSEKMKVGMPTASAMTPMSTGDQPATSCR